MTDTYGLVLAGGKSRRMGHDKALLSLNGKSQLRRSVELLETALPRVFVSARSDQQNEPERAHFETIVDRYDGIGPAAGILSGMETFPDVNWLVVACDLPNIEAATIEFLLDSSSDKHDFTAYKSSYDGLPEPLCAIYPARSAAIIRAFVDAGLVCPRKMLIRSNTLLLQQPDPQALNNVNTPEDLRGSDLEVVS